MMQTDNKNVYKTDIDDSAILSVFEHSQLLVLIITNQLNVFIDLLLTYLSSYHEKGINALYELT